MIFTNGDYNRPRISRVITFNDRYENNMAEYKEWIYDADGQRDPSRIGETLSLIEVFEGDGYVSERSHEPFLRYDRENRAGEGSNRGAAFEGTERESGKVKSSKKDKPTRAIPNAQEAAEIEAQAKVRQEEAEAERARYREEFMRRFVEQSPAHQKHSRKDTIDEMADKHGRILQGENPVRDVVVPRSTDGNTKVRQTVRTAMEAKVTPDSLLPTIEDSIIAGTFNYEADTNKKQVERAKAWAESRSIKAAVMIGARMLRPVRHQPTS